VDHELTDLFQGYLDEKIIFEASSIRISYGEEVPVSFAMERAQTWRVNRRTHHTLVQVKFDSVTKGREGEE